MADTVGSNVLFLRGAQAQLPSSGAQPGAFYLTEDTHRLYAGNANGGVDLLSQAIAVLATVADLEDEVKAPRINGQFVYIADGNILAVYENDEKGVAGWKQINAQKDHYATSQAYNVSKEADGSIKIANAIGIKEQTATVNGDFSLVGSGDVELSAPTAGKADIYVAPYILEKEEVGTSISLSKTDKAGNKSSGTAITFEAGNDNVTVASGKGASAHSILISANDTQNKVSAASLSALDAGFGLSITNASKDATSETWVDASPVVTASINPLIALSSKVGGEGADKDNYKQSVPFVNGTAVLDVYSKEEIDAMQLAMDAMHYMGVIGEDSVDGDGKMTMPAPTEGLKIGNTYKVGANGTATIKTSKDGAASGVTLHVNDVVIANGVEDAYGKIDPDTLYWDVIPAGAASENAISYIGAASATTNVAVLDIKERTGNASGSSVAKIAVTAGAGLAIADADASGTNQEFTIKHAAIDAPTTSGSAADVDALHTTTNGTAEFSAVTAVNEDGMGHVTGLTIKKITVSDTVLTASTTAMSGSVAAADNVATVTTQMSLSDTSGQVVSGSNAFKLGSPNSCITVSVDDTDSSKVNLNLVWGSF